MEYFAFGETFVEEHKNSINSPFKFNGKELDEESGLYYYGARYYDPKLSIWASVDPLAEKFAGRSSYEYCFSNPVNLTDPTGMGPEDDPGKKGWAGRAWDTVKSWFSGSKKKRENTEKIEVGPLEEVIGGVASVLDDVLSGTFIDNPLHAGYDIGTKAPPTAEDFNKLPTFIYDKNGDGIVTVDEVAQDQFETANYLFLLSSLGTTTVSKGIGLVDDVLSTATKTSTSLVETASGILKPAGSIIGKAGSNASIRELTGGMKAAQSYWSRLVTSGAKPILGSSYKGTLMQLPNGGTVGFRTMMSRSPGTTATIDVNVPGLFQGKLKFNP